MRLLHYPPITGEPGSNVRAGAHEDINTITLLLGAEEAGLELLTKDGRWIPVAPDARRAGRQYRRHAAAADQRAASLDHPPGGQPAARAPRQVALLDAVLPPLPLGFHDRGAARNRARRASSPNGRRSPPTSTSRSGCARSSWSDRSPVWSVSDQTFLAKTADFGPSSRHWLGANHRWAWPTTERRNRTTLPRGKPNASPSMPRSALRRPGQNHYRVPAYDASPLGLQA